MSAEALNSLTPPNIYKIDKSTKNLFNKALGGHLSSVAFVRETIPGFFEMQPATYGDKKLLLNIAIKLNLKLEKI